MQKNIYFVVLDLHTTDRDKIIQLFKDWTDYSAKLVEGELVKKDGQNALFPPSDTGETVGLNPHRLTLTFGVSASFLKKMNLENKRPRLFRDLPLFPKEQLREKYTGGDIVIHACADDEQIAFHVIRNLIRKGRNAVPLRWSQSGFAAIGDEWRLRGTSLVLRMEQQIQPRSKTLTALSGLIVRTGWKMVLIWQFVGFRCF
ncbi:peroxidase [Streptococcus pneumoniae]|nr:dyp-type peroxidase family protein [Streptococcus pneumoniae 2072047]EJG62409.1 dyp-type peroxidase family protein [Streptococcus pneumoniae 2071004]CEV41585.1 peroxidase [Streptococcus pneumoniae]CJB53270.1 peroxidase [Streptococcus pneumoniae]CJG22134.1 peroxidase [Streptococcus pneumoniae]